MFDKKKIKVVKKAEIATKPSRKQRKTTSRAAARDIVANVTGWVSDIRQRKTRETKAALELLFSKNTMPSES